MNITNNELQEIFEEKTSDIGFCFDQLWGDDFENPYENEDTHLAYMLFKLGFHASSERSNSAKYNWSNIPSWVEWIATSPDHKAWGFTHKPQICGDNNQDWGLIQEDSWSDVVAVSKFKGSWKDSLEKRPQEHSHD